MQAVGRAVRSAPGVAVGALRRPVATAREAFVTAGSLLRMVRPVTDTKSPVMRARRLGWHYGVFDVDLDAMKNAAKASQGTLNDVFLAGIVAGLRRYHEHHGAEPAELRVTMPISIREPGDPPGGNRITLMRFGVPVAQKDPATEIAVLHARAAASRQERAVAYTNTVAEVLNLLPRGFVGGMLKHIDFLASNVPGLDTAVFVGGARVDEFYAFGPTIGAALNVTLLSYCSTCFLGVNTDTGAIPDPDSLVDCLRAGFAEVVKVGVGASGEPGA
jgi:diacylglycerol O-acyltransferase